LIEVVSRIIRASNSPSRLKSFLVIGSISTPSFSASRAQCSRLSRVGGGQLFVRIAQHGDRPFRHDAGFGALPRATGVCRQARNEELELLVLQLGERRDPDAFDLEFARRAVRRCRHHHHRRTVPVEQLSPNLRNRSSSTSPKHTTRRSGTGPFAVPLVRSLCSNSSRIDAVSSGISRSSEVEQRLHRRDHPMPARLAQQGGVVPVRLVIVRYAPG